MASLCPQNTSAGFKFLFSACSLSVHGKLGHKVNLGLDAEPLVPLLGDGQLDTLALGQRDERLVALKDKMMRNDLHLDLDK